MANDLNGGAAKLVERILLDAQREAETLSAGAEAEIEKIKALAGQQAAQLREAGAQESKKACDAILERSRTNAELDSRKYALSAKRAVVEESFQKAYGALLALTGERRDALLRGCAAREALGGEILLPSAADKANMERLLPGINEQLQKSGRKPLALGDGVPNMAAGFLLRGEGFEKNCSFEAMLRDVREAQESKVAAILFQ